MSILAKIVNYDDLPDSLQLQIRLRSHILVSARNNFLDSILMSQAEELLLAFFCDDSCDLPAFYEKLRIYSRNHSQIIILTKDKSIVTDSLQTKVILCNPEKVDNIVMFGDTVNPDLFDSNLSSNELLCVTVINSQLDYENDFFTLWKTSGKLPNFIRVNPDEFKIISKIVLKLNETPKIFGEVFENSRLLTEVYWENKPGVKTYGYFSFPLIHDTYTRLIPYKAGYRFSPDIIYRSGSNMRDIKTFHAIKHDLDFELNDYFTFKKKVRNKKRNNDFIINGVEFKKDSKQGDVALFADKAFIDAGLQSRESLKSNFSIIAWVKPTELGDNNSILGKGNNFVLKIHDGKLTFTMAGIKDYISENSPIPVNVWTQVSMVYSKFNNRIDFYVNGKHTEQINLLTEYEGSDYTLLIGSNLWEEFFIGYLGDMKIWDRELNEEEIQNQYFKGSRKNSPVLLLFFMSIFIAALIIYYAIRRYKRSKKKHSLIKNSSQNKSRQDIIKGERLYFFGGLKVINTNGEDISQRFSPKLKQLFALIFIYSHGSNKGITSKQLTEILWPGMNTTNAKNVRGTYIQNLRSAISSFNEINLVFSNKLWFFDIKESCYDEYSEVEKFISIPYKKQDLFLIEKYLFKTIVILKKGRFLSDIEESWLDPFVENINNRIIEFCILMFNILDDKTHAKLILDFVDIILINDPLNEIALHKKIGLLVDQGRLGFARNVYDNFIKLYRELYKENYSVDFYDLITNREVKLDDSI